MQLLRSLLFVPGHRSRMVDRALGIGEFTPGPLDVAILDLEDGVPLGEKERARVTVGAALGRASNGRGPTRLVRINSAGDQRPADLAAVVREGLGGIVAPKVEHAGEIASLARALDQQEREAGLIDGSIRVIASIESARGLLDAVAIATASDRVIALLFGAEDFALDLGLPAVREAEAADLVHARSAVVVAAAAASKVAIDGIWPDLQDARGLREDALRARRLGFAGKSLIHPAQVEPINQIFSPSASEIAHARRVVAAFDEAAARGAAAVTLDGKLVDPPIVERARRTLRTADAIARG